MHKPSLPAHMASVQPLMKRMLEVNEWEKLNASHFIFHNIFINGSVTGRLELVCALKEHNTHCIFIEIRKKNAYKHTLPLTFHLVLLDCFLDNISLQSK